MALENGTNKNAPKMPLPSLPEGKKARGNNAIIVKPVANAIRILRFFGETKKAARASQIAAALSLNASTCFNILRTLTNEGVVEFDNLSKTYSTGIGLAKLANGAITENQRISAAKPLMHEVAAQFSVTLSLWRRGNDDRITLVAVEHSPSEMRVNVVEGQRLPLLMGASGRALALHLGFSKAQLRAAFKTLRWQRPLSFEAYCSQIETAREVGFAVDEGHFARGVMTVSAPVLDSQGYAGFAVTAVMFQGQFDEDVVSEIGHALTHLAPRLSTLLY
jgi:DNA-binding IclR family transcriptional regulator